MSEIIAAILEGLIAAGAHELDPEARKAAVRAAVEAERARWEALDHRTTNDLLDELARRHHTHLASVEPTRPVDPAPARDDEPTARVKP